MSLISLPRTYSSMKRLRQIAMTLARHGFSHVVSRIHIAEHVPGLSRFKMTLEEAREAGTELSAPQRLCRVFQELGATFIKFGQLLATRPDLVPASFIEEFSRLQDSVDPLSADVVRTTIEECLQCQVSEIFAEFDDHAVASGSIGQVHNAVLKNGCRVVVKVKRPGTDSRVREDLDLLAGLAGLIETHLPELRVLRPKMLVEEFARCMKRELDFVGEASYTGKFRTGFAEDSSVIIPRVHWEYVTRDTLVLERMSGIRLTDPDELQAHGIDKRELARTLGRCLMRQYFESGFFHADPHPGNILVHDNGCIALVDFGQVGHLSDELRRQLALTLLALAQGDTDFIVDLYADIGVFSEETNTREFKAELRGLVDRYYGVPLVHLDMAAAFHEIMSVARNHHIVMPREFVLLGKSFVTAMGVLRSLDPDFRADVVVKPFSREIFGNLAEPRSLLKRLSLYSYRVMNVLRRAPDDMRELLDKAKAGQIRIIFHHEGLDDLSAQMERSANRLTLGIIIAAIVIGSSIVLTAGNKALGQQSSLPVIGNFPISVIVAGFGFAFAVVIGLWVAWGILRKN